MAIVQVKDLIEAGVHFGHRASRWNPKMRPYIYGKRNLIHIIDLRETVRGLLRGYRYIAQVVSQGHLVLFVGTKRQAKESIDMIAPPGEPEPLPERAAGFWVELRDGRGRRLYQRVIQQPVRFEVEVFPEKLDDPIEWRPLASPEGTFALVVPDLPDARTVVLFSSPFEPGRSGEPAEDVRRASPSISPTR